MKFKFCSDGDCPLWALAALHALSSLPSQMFRALLDRVLSNDTDDGIMEILKDTSLASRDESARAAAVLRWVLHSAWCCSCSGAQLARDLAVLGVPRTHATALADAVDQGREAYEKRVQGSGFVVNNLTDVTASTPPDCGVESIKLTLHSETITGDQNSQDIIIEKSQAKTLLEELKKAYKKLEEIDNVNRDE